MNTRSLAISRRRLVLLHGRDDLLAGGNGLLVRHPLGLERCARSGVCDYRLIGIAPVPRGCRDRPAGRIEAQGSLLFRRAVPGLRRQGRSGGAVVQPVAPRGGAATAAAGSRLRDPIRRRWTQQLSIAHRVAEGARRRPHVHRGCCRSAAQVSGGAHRVHVGPAFFRPGHAARGHSVRPLARAPRACARGAGLPTTRVRSRRATSQRDWRYRRRATNCSSCPRR